MRIKNISSLMTIARDVAFAPENVQKNVSAWKMRGGFRND
jgi:hypothetical protein